MLGVLVGTDTVTAQGHSPWTRHASSGDFYLAKNGDLHPATTGDFFMAMDTHSDGCARRLWLMSGSGLPERCDVVGPDLNFDVVLEVVAPVALVAAGCRTVREPVRVDHGGQFVDSEDSAVMRTH